MTTRQAVQYLRSKGLKITYNQLLHLVRSGEGPVCIKSKTYCGWAYIFEKDNLDNFLLKMKDKCLNCGAVIQNGKFCSKRCEQRYYAKYRKEKINALIIEGCPFMSGRIKTYIPDVDPRSSNFCPFI